MDRKIAIMATGGMDSTVLMYQYADYNPTIITVDYGHISFPKQIENLKYHIKKLDLAPLVIIPVLFLNWQVTKALFTPNFHPKEKEPLANWDEMRYKESFIEGRNMIMLGYVMAYCSAHNIDELMAGYLYSKEEWEKRRSIKLMTGDNSPQFVDMINLLSQVGFSYQVRFRAPFYEERYSKQEVYNLGIKLGVDFNYTYSCYFVPECGKCDNCLLRAEIIKTKE